ncbi:peroxidase family protein [Kitasatospora sp. NPDC004799]|uniref:peroxidase family protein n=1 Tax=Kitasatospora sp. NPDC004799 TaxID=3154460 RepID=UPI0033A26EAE
MTTDTTTADAPADGVATRREEARTRLLDQLLGRDGQAALNPDGLRVADPTFTGHGCPLRLDVGDGTRPTGQHTPVAFRDTVVETGTYTWLFPALNGYVPADDLIEELGAPGGPMDLNPPLPFDRRQCAELGEKIDDKYLAKPSAPSTEPAKAGIPAGYTYLGQFLDHNITFQADATFDSNTIGNTTNFRSARVDLSHVYGLGPKTQSFAFYDNLDVGKFWIDPNRDYDVPRNPQGVPVIADPRNDNTIISIQIHHAFMLFHNAVVDMLKGSVPDVALFDTAKQQVVWHYQWMILNDWLPRIVKDSVYAKVKAAAEDKDAPFLVFNPSPDKPVALPLEFTAAAYRLHSLPVEEYRLNGTTTGHLFNFRRPFSPLRTEQVIDWRQFFVIPKASQQPQYAKRFDRKIIHAFLQMPPPVDSPLTWLEDSTEKEELPDGNPYKGQSYSPLLSIAIRNLRRANSFVRKDGTKGLPSGEDLAREVYAKYNPGHDPYTPKDFGLKDFDHVPPWYYVLGEGALEEKSDVGSLKLGTLGSALVGEVIAALVKTDPGSYLSHNSKYPANPWKPTFGEVPGTFYMSDLVRIAGLV